VAAAEVTLMGPAVRPASGALGGIEESRVQQTIQLLTDAGAIPSGSLAVKDIVAAS
jgi:hypothetical protein